MDGWESGSPFICTIMPRRGRKGVIDWQSLMEGNVYNYQSYIGNEVLRGLMDL